MSTTNLATLERSGVDLPRVVTRWLYAPLCPPVVRPPGKKRSWIDPWVRWFVYWRDGRTCQECGAADLIDATERLYERTSWPYITLDHVLAWSLGGCDHVHNLRVLCSTCNFRRGAKP